MSKGTALILGARSDIAMAVSHGFAKAGYDIQMAARDAESLNDDRSDIQLRYGVSVTLHEFDVLDIEAHTAFVENLPQAPTVAVCAVGYMGDQDQCEKDPLAAANVIRSNFEGPATVLSVLAEHFVQNGSGTLVGISSVAGQRGRAKNYIYGSAKAGFSAFLSGLRNRLAGKGVHVVTVLPGFVETRMTAGMNLPAKLTAQPTEVADAILKAVERQQNIVYVKPIWRFIMIVIGCIPESLFKKMNI